MECSNIEVQPKITEFGFECGKTLKQNSSLIKVEY